MEPPPFASSPDNESNSSRPPDQPVLSPSDELQFDHAEMDDTGGGAVSCAACKSPVTGYYYQINGRTACPACHDKLAAHLASGSPFLRLAKAVVFGLVAAAAGLERDHWSWSYQSAGRSPGPWLGPQLPEHLRALAEQGVRSVVSVPVGFVADHVEILYDIDIQAQQTAAKLGMRLVRPPSLNDDPLFVAAMANVIRYKAHEMGWE